MDHVSVMSAVTVAVAPTQGEAVNLAHGHVHGFFQGRNPRTGNPEVAAVALVFRNALLHQAYPVMQIVRVPQPHLLGPPQNDGDWVTTMVPMALETVLLWQNNYTPELARIGDWRLVHDLPVKPEVTH